MAPRPKSTEIERLKNILSELDEKLKESRLKCSKLEDSLSDQAQKIANLEMESITKDSKIETLEAEINSSGHILANMSEQNSRLRKQFSDLRGGISEFDNPDVQTIPRCLKELGNVFGKIQDNTTKIETFKAFVKAVIDGNEELYDSIWKRIHTLNQDCAVVRDSLVDMRKTLENLT